MSAKWVIGDVTGTLFRDGEPTGVEFKVFNGTAHEELVREANRTALDLTSNEMWEVLEAIDGQLRYLNEGIEMEKRRGTTISSYAQSIEELKKAQEKIREARRQTIATAKKSEVAA